MVILICLILHLLYGLPGISNVPKLFRPKGYAVLFSSSSFSSNFSQLNDYLILAGQHTVICLMPISLLKISFFSLHHLLSLSFSFSVFLFSFPLCPGLSPDLPVHNAVHIYIMYTLHIIHYIYVYCIIVLCPGISPDLPVSPGISPDLRSTHIYNVYFAYYTLYICVLHYCFVSRYLSRSPCT